MADEETGIAPRKTRTEEAELDITPMIDVTFLLLAFFVFVSKMDPTTACLLYTSPSPRDLSTSRMPSSA